MKTFKLKSSITQVSAEKSLSKAEELLTLFGSTKIMKDYENGHVISIAFNIDKQAYKIPFNIKGVSTTISLNAVDKLFKINLKLPS